jgi:hypothetical protein
MKKSISKKLADIVLEAQEMEVSYNEGRILNASERLDKIVELLDTVSEALENEPLGRLDTDEIAKIFEEAEKSPKFGHLPTKNN